MNRKTISGRLYSDKMNRTISFHTALQRDYIFLLEHDPDVVAYKTRPFKIPMTIGHSHTPDFLAVYEDGSNHVIDCVYELKKTEKANAKRKEVEQYSRERRFEYRIVTNEEMWSDYLILNLQTMFACRRYQIDEELRQHVLECLSACRTWTAGQLIDAAKDAGLSAGLYSLVVLVKQGDIHMDLRSRELSRLTKVRMAP